MALGKSFKPQLAFDKRRLCGAFSPLFSCPLFAFYQLMQQIGNGMEEMDSGQLPFGTMEYAIAKVSLLHCK